MKHLLLLGTGGTIACKRGENGLTPLLTGDELLSYVPDAKKFCEVETVQVLNIDSTNMHPKHWLKLAQVLEENYDNYDGFVICHGTDTMAYTAAAMSYLVQHSSKPIVITGAQKPIDLDVTDTRTNLLDSLRFAASDRAHGVTIVFDGKVIAGTRGKKERSKSYNAFSSINFPYLAVIQDEHILYYIDDKWQDRESVRFYHEMDSQVSLLKLIPSMDSSLLDYMAEHYDAVVIESFGVGGLPSYESGDFYSSIEKWISMGKVVVMGRKTLESFPNGMPLPKRTNIVLTHDKDYDAKGAIVVGSKEELLDELEEYKDEDIFIIGGESIYRMMLPYCDTAYVTRTDFAYDADTYFPDLDEMPEWKLVKESEEETYFDIEYQFLVYRK